MRFVVHAVMMAAFATLSACDVSSPSSREASTAHAGVGAVVSAESLATEIGAAILETGGNAVDAAVAVHFALAVTYPYAGNLGGGGFMLISTGDGHVEALDYREAAPQAAHPAVYQDANGGVDPDLSRNTLRASGVPGSVLGMWEAHQRYGSLSWQELIAPAIELAETGFIVDSRSAELIRKKTKAVAAMKDELRNRINFAEYFHVRNGETLVQAELAATLRRIAQDGPTDFYYGETASMIVEAMKSAGGWIDEADLAQYRVHWRVPISGEFRGHRIVSMPPPSSGGIALIQMLNLFDRFDLPEYHTEDHLNLVAEIEKRVFADRATYLGDPDFFAVPVTDLIDQDYLSSRAAEISRKRRSDPHSIEAGLSTRVGESPETTHFSIVDKNSMAVACTTTLNGAFGSGIVVPGAGFLLNNEMDDFSAKPGTPNMYGVVGGEANKIEGGKRMLSSMTPTMVFSDEGDLRLILGSPGGSVIFTTVFQVIVNRLAYDFDLERSVRELRFHHQWPPIADEGDAMIVERMESRSFPDEVLQGLEEMGYVIRFRESLGNVHIIERLDRETKGVADTRRGGNVHLIH